MKIAVVIPALDEVHDIAGAVASAQAPGAEIVVVDGGSSDATRSLARAAGARVIESPPGRSRQLRAGVLATEAGETDGETGGAGDHGAESEAVLFLHADTRLPAGWEREVAHALADSRVVGGAFRLRFDEPGAALRLFEYGVRLRVLLFRLPYGDQAIFARRAVLATIGGVPPVGFMEDLDLVKAMKTEGRLASVPAFVTTSARRYRRDGLVRTAGRHLLAAAAWSLGVERGRIESWVRR